MPDISSGGGLSAGLYFPTLTGRGGAERLTLIMAIELARMGYATTIFTMSSDPPEVIERDLGERIDGIAITLLPEAPRGRRFRAISEAATIARHAAAIRRRRLSLFINTDYRSEFPGCGRENVLYCHFPHDMRIGSDGAARRLYLDVLSRIKRVAVDRDPGGPLATYQHIWANSHFTAGHVGRMWQREAEVVYPPCDGLAPAPKEKLIVAVGRFQASRSPSIPHKSQEQLIRAFRMLPDLHRDGWRLALLGAMGEADRDFVAHLDREREGFPIDIRPNPSRGELAATVGRASIFWHAQGVDGDARAHPHTQEHFGISTVEAMSAGAVPLVYGSAGPAEIVGGVSQIRPWTSLEELLADTRSVAALPEEQRSAIARACIDRAGDFDREHFSRRLREVLPHEG